jgi:hypothetical protein
LDSAFPEFAAFYAIALRLQLWKSQTAAPNAPFPRPVMSTGHLPLALLGVYTEILPECADDI